MIASIEKSTAFGEVVAPPSKSMAHRYLICGALSGGSVIENVAFSEDIKATIECLSALGARVKVNGSTVEIGGISKEKQINSPTAFCNESGSTLRFLIPLCLLKDEEITLTGTERLFSRKLTVFEDICKAQGLKFTQTENSVALKGKISTGRYSVRGDISSQFISGLMFALPCLEGESVIDIVGKLESAPYLNLTLKALADFGVRVSRIDENTMYIKGEQLYKKRNVTVEGDYSNAAFLDAFNLIGGNVAVKGLDGDSVQGDRAYKEYFARLSRGADVLDVSDCPDLAPILMAVAATQQGVVLNGTQRLKIKESDRGMAMAEELAKFGCKVDVEENQIKVYPCTLKKPILPLSGHNDHRIVMAVSFLASLTGGKIYGAEAVAKSYPDFFKEISSLGIRLKVENE